MKSRKGFTLIELLVVIAIIAVLAAILFPVFAKARKAAQASNCQSNMKQIGNAFKMYLSDWEDTYPTNRGKGPNPSTAGPINPIITLSPPDIDPSTGQPLRFVYGIAWVESLYSYVESVSKDAASVWKCQAASNQSHPANDFRAAVTYSYNYNMLEQPEGVIKGAANLMLVREVDRLVNAICTPKNNTTGNASLQPADAFLDGRAESMNNLLLDHKGRLHGNGSHILFADGHVKLFDRSFMPDDGQLRWDNDTQQWYNFVYPDNTTDATQKKLNKTIAVTP